MFSSSKYIHTPRSYIQTYGSLQAASHDDSESIMEEMEENASESIDEASEPVNNI